MTPENPLVSIIIPTYNRAHLIGETLDSVLAQTYENWECIVVDDGSTDNTEELMAEYMTKDARFQYHHRPKDRLPGGNAARNYGFEVSMGEYIQWFDSDDLMASNFLSRKLEELRKRDVDFIVSRCLNFDSKDTYVVNKYNGNLSNEFSGENYIQEKIYWMTPDFLIKRSCVEECHFDESLKSGQETNFFIVFLSKTICKGIFINENLSFRRLHDLSIQQKLKKSKNAAYLGKLKSLLSTYMQVYKDIDYETKYLLQNKIMTIYYKLKLKNVESTGFFKFSINLILNRNIIKTTSFLISFFLNSYLNMGYKLFEFSRK